MTQVVLRACGIALLSLVCILIAGREAGGYAAAIRICGGLALLCLTLGVLGESIDAMGIFGEEIFAAGGFGEAMELMLKALGISLACRAASDVCRDCGEAGLGEKVDSLGHVVILGMSVSMIHKIILLCAGLLER